MRGDISDKSQCALGDNIAPQLREGADLADNSSSAEQAKPRAAINSVYGVHVSVCVCVCVCVERGQRLLPVERKGSGEDLRPQRLSRCLVASAMLRQPSH